MTEQLKYLVGQNIRKQRRKQRLFQKQLAELADIDDKYLQRIEGKKPPNISLKVIEKLAKALKVSPDRLLKQ